MTPVELGLVAIIALFILLFIRVPVAFSMISVSFVGMIALRPAAGIMPALNKLAIDVFGTMQTYSLSVIPLFVLMGVFLAKANVGVELYELLNAMIGRRKGGMAVATLAATTAFSAVCGSVVASVSTMTAVSFPEMKKYKYDEGFAAAITALGSSLSVIIPPSTALVVYGVLTEESIGQVLIAGIVPGVMTAILLILTVPIVLAFKPHLAPPARKEKIPFPWQTLKYVWAIPVIFIICIGGIYGGFFTPTEAGSVGAFASLLFAVFTRRINFKGIVESLLVSARTSAMVFFVFIGGKMLGAFLSMTTLPQAMATFIGGLDIAPFFIILFMLLIYTLLGLFMDEMSDLVILTPILYPIAVTALGYDGIWFGMLSMMALLTGFLTPPVGIVTLVAASVSKVPSGKVFAAEWPFWITIIVACIIVAAFPDICTFLPRMMYK